TPYSPLRTTSGPRQSQPSAGRTPGPNIPRSTSSESSKLKLEKGTLRQPPARPAPSVWQHPSESSSTDVESSDKFSSSNVNVPETASMNPPESPRSQPPAPLLQSLTPVPVSEDRDDDRQTDQPLDNSGLAQPGPLGKSNHTARRYSSSSTALPETFQSTASNDGASNYDACGGYQPPYPYASEDTHHSPSTPSLHDSFSSPLKRRREDTCDSGFGSSVPDIPDHIRGGYAASYASSAAGSLPGYTVAGLDQGSAQHMERMQATMQASGDIVQTHWDELTSVRRNYNDA
ncbi:hypothetical protein BJ508DRAFT_316467, partial [Ascobolus immersus RN42]